MKVVSLSAVGTDHLYRPGSIRGTHFYYRLSWPQGHSAAGRIMSTKNPNDNNGNRTRDLSACSAMPQPTAPPCAPALVSPTLPKTNAPWFIYCPPTLKCGAMPYPAVNSGSSEWTAFSSRNLRSYYFVPSAYDHWLDSKTICRCLRRLRFLVRVAGACSNKMSCARLAEARICVEFVVDKCHWDRSLPSTSFLTCQLSYHQYFIYIHLPAVGWTLGLLAAVVVSERHRITQQRGSKQRNVKQTCTYTGPRE
jgi:hypothetical protein